MPPTNQLMYLMSNLLIHSSRSSNVRSSPGLKSSPLMYHRLKTFKLRQLLHSFRTWLASIGCFGVLLIQANYPSSSLAILSCTIIRLLPRRHLWSFNCKRSTTINFLEIALPAASLETIIKHATAPISFVRSQVPLLCLP